MDGRTDSTGDPEAPPSPVPNELYDSGSDLEPMGADFVADFDEVNTDDEDDDSEPEVKKIPLKAPPAKGSKSKWTRLGLLFAFSFCTVSANMISLN